MSGSSYSKIDPKAQIVERSAILKVVISGVMYWPGKALRSSTIPLNGEWSAKVRRTWPLRSSSLMCSSGTSQSLSRSLAAARRLSAAARDVAIGLPANCALFRTARRYSVWVETSSGL